MDVGLKEANLSPPACHTAAGVQGARDIGRGRVHRCSGRWMARKSLYLLRIVAVEGLCHRRVINNRTAVGYDLPHVRAISSRQRHGCDGRSSLCLRCQRAPDDAAHDAWGGGSREVGSGREKAVRKMCTVSCGSVWTRFPARTTGRRFSDRSLVGTR